MLPIEEEPNYGSLYSEFLGNFKPEDPEAFQKSWIEMKELELQGELSFDSALEILRKNYDRGMVPEKDMTAFNILP